MNIGEIFWQHLRRNLAYQIRRFMLFFLRQDLLDRISSNPEDFKLRILKPSGQNSVEKQE